MSETGSGQGAGALAESSRSLDRATDAYVARDLRCGEFHESLIITWTHRVVRGFGPAAEITSCGGAFAGGSDSGAWREAACAWFRWELHRGTTPGPWWEAAYAWFRWEFRRVGDWQPSVDRDGAYGNGTIDRTHGWAPWDSARAVRSLRWAALTRLTCLFAVFESAGAAC